MNYVSNPLASTRIIVSRTKSDHHSSFKCEFHRSICQTIPLFAARVTGTIYTDRRDAYTPHKVSVYQSRITHKRVEKLFVNVLLHGSPKEPIKGGEGRAFPLLYITVTYTLVQAIGECT